MINRVEIRNWQSLVKVDLPLGQFTAIVGRSSCGKTALVRALTALASNTRGAGSITSGARTSIITAYTDTHKITWQRSVSDGGRYILTDTKTGKEDTYTKLAGAVPPQITAALHIAPAPTAGVSLNIAPQFQPPFLLTESGAAVARLLGQLTNVSTILTAVQEAHRRRQALQQTLKLRESDLADKLSRAQAFLTLPDRLEARTRAEQHGERAERLQSQIARLHYLFEKLTVADGVLARAAQRPPVPDDTAIRAAADRLALYKAHIRTWIAANAAVDQAASRASALEQAELDAQQALDEALQTAGYCPTCGRVVEAHPHEA